MYVFMGLLGLAMIGLDIRGIVIMFGGHKSAPIGLRIAIGITMALTLVSMFNSYE